MPVDTQKLRRTLRRFIDVLADEADRNPEFAAVLADAIGPSSQPVQNKGSKGKKKALWDGHEPDPFEIFSSQGMEGLRKWLESLTFDQMRSIVHKHRFDPARVSAKWKEKDREKFISMISDRIEARTDQGKAFRHYNSQSRDGSASTPKIEEKEAEQQSPRSENSGEKPKEEGPGSTLEESRQQEFDDAGTDRKTPDSKSHGPESPS